MTPREVVLRTTIPLVINVFNQFFYLKNMVEKFSRVGFKNIIILDNNSTYEPLLEYYQSISKSGKAIVIYYNENRGPHYFFTAKIYYHLLNNIPFLYTDPDLHWDSISSEFLSRLFDVSYNYRQYKVGCALKLPTQSELKLNLPRFRSHGREFDVRDWEQQFWEKEIEPEIYDAPLDTTMHLHNSPLVALESPFFTGLRIAGKGMEALHLPWLKEDPCPEAERTYYMANTQAKHSTWNGKVPPPELDS